MSLFQTKSIDELTTEMNGKIQFPGWTNAWTMPIKTRVDMLTTGVRTPVGIKVFGTDLNEVERLGVSLEHLMAPIRGTRSTTTRTMARSTASRATAARRAAPCASRAWARRSTA